MFDLISFLITSRVVFSSFKTTIGNTVRIKLRDFSIKAFSSNKVVICIFDRVGVVGGAVGAGVGAVMKGRCGAAEWAAYKLPSLIPKQLNEYAVIRNP